MGIHFNPTDTDTAHFEFSNNEIVESREVGENVYMDLDSSGNLVSMTIEHAKANAGLKEFSYQEMVTDQVLSK